MIRLRASLLSLVLLLGACTLANGQRKAVSNDSGFSVRATAEGLVLRNASAVRVHYVAVEQETAALLDLNPDVTTWASVAPGQEKRVPYSEVNGYERGAEKVVVHWATAEPRTAGHLVVTVP